MGHQQRGEETRMRILQAASICFAQHGYDATGVAEICDQAGVTKGGFYHHFDSKQAVFLELLQGWLAGVDAQIQSIATTSGNVPEALQQMAGMVQPIFTVGRGQLPLFLEFWSKAAREPEIWKKVIAPYHQYSAFFTELIGRGVAEGSLKPVEPEQVANLLVSIAVGLVLQGLLDPQGEDWAAEAQKSIALFVSCLRKE